MIEETKILKKITKSNRAKLADSETVSKDITKLADSELVSKKRVSIKEVPVDTATAKVDTATAKVDTATAKVDTATAKVDTATEITINSTLVALKKYCKQLGIKGISKKNKTELLEIIKNHN